MKRIALALSWPLFVCQVPAQHTLERGKPADVGISRNGLIAAARLFERAVEKGELRGVVLLVARNGKIVLHEAYGWRDEKKKQRMKKASLFRMASNSKAVTAAGVLLLADEGKLKLGDPVYKYLPSFENDKARAITIEHLLTHTSGMRIRPIFIRPLLKKSKEHPTAPSLQAEVTRFGAIGAAEEPGTTYSYSNAGYNTLAGLIEVVSKQDYRVFLRDRIYKPLGMKDSCNHESEADHQRMSAIFRRGRDGTWRTGWKPGDKPDYPFPRGSGGMISTARDYAVFCQMYLNGGSYGKIRILQTDTVQAALTSRTDHTRGDRGYGHGWMIEGASFSHGGSDGTWGWADRKRGLIGLVFTQSPGGENPRTKFREIVTAACTDNQ